MMQTIGVSASSLGTAATSFEALGKDEFLKLFITKLRNQDPLAPAEDEQFLAQLAQFSALEQAMESNGLLSELVQGQQGDARGRMMDLLGRQVLAGGDLPVQVAAGVAEGFAVDLAGEAQSVKVEILDGSGAVIRTIDLGARPAGRVAVSWDGLDAGGSPVADGAYVLRVRATDEKGADVDAEALVYVRVDALRLLGGAIVPLSQGRIIDIVTIQEVTV